VIDRLTFDTDDTVRAPAPRPPAHDPLRGWWVGPLEDQPVIGDATAVDNGVNISAYAKRVDRSEALR
jgi:hypothetical protein